MLSTPHKAAKILFLDNKPVNNVHCITKPHKHTRSIIIQKDKNGMFDITTDKNLLLATVQDHLQFKKRSKINKGLTFSYSVLISIFSHSSQSQK